MHQTPEPIPEFNVPVVSSCLCIVLGVLFTLIVVTPNPPMPTPSIVLDPFEIGSKNEYQRATNNPTTALASDVNHHQVTVNENEIIIAPKNSGSLQINDQPPDNNAPTFDILHANAEGIATDPFVRLALTGIALNQPPGQTQSLPQSGEPQSSFFDAQGITQTDGGLSKASNSDPIVPIKTNGLFPTIRLRFQGDFPRGAKLASIRFFNQQTFHEVGDLRRVHGELNGTLHADLELHCWHQTPLVIVVEFQEQWTPASTFPLAQNTTYHYNQSKLRFLGHVPGPGKVITRTRKSSSPRSPEAGMTLRYHLEPAEKPTRGSIYVFETHAHTNPLFRRFNIELLDSSGTQIKQWIQSRQQRDPLIEIHMENGSPEASMIRVQAHAFSYRAIFNLKSIPGLPSSNQSITNLLDATIPSLHINDIYEFRHVIYKLTTLIELNPPPHRPDLSFPMSFRNITLAELMETYQSLYPPHHHLVVDMRSKTFSIQRNPVTGIRSRLKRDLQHLFDWK